MAKQIAKTLEEAKELWPEIPISDKVNNLSGQTFSRLTVLYRTNKINNNQRAFWVCQCICGNYVAINAGNLLAGTTKSCGCLHIEQAKERAKEIATKYLINLENGQCFGRLTVIERVYNTNKKGIYYKCKCDCGNEINVLHSSLLSGKTKSCGCYQKEQTGKKNRKDITGLQSGFLIALEPTEQRTDSSQVIWKCLCTNCGNITYKPTNPLTAHEIISCGCVKSQYELMIKNYLNNHNINFKQEYTFEDLKLIYKLRFDFGLLNQDNQLLALIEFQGQQHYRIGYKDFGKQQREITDPMKKEYCKKNNIPLYEIRYDENIEERLQKILNEVYKQEI